jgi:hypothetical protein
MRVSVADPFTLRGDPEQMLSDDQTEQLNIIQPWLAASMMIA